MAAPESMESTIWNHLESSASAECSRKILGCARAYLGNKANRGQHDRALGIEPAGDREQIFSLIDCYLRGQEHKWNRLGAVIDEYLGGPPARILDAGSSIGHASLALSFRYPEARVTGYELESEAVELARALASERAQCRFVNAPIENLRDEDGPFDFIHCSNVLEHVEKPKVVLGRLVTSLTPRGVMLISGPNYLFPWEHHVHCWMLPGGPKPLVKWVLRRRGDANPSFIDHLRLEVNTWSVKRWLRATGIVEWRDLSHAKIDEILMGAGNGLFVPQMVARIKALRLHRVVAKIARWFPLTPSMVLLVKRY
ncbi:MAG: class I SAM-dependent methyltransferase [Bryobacteraceae bacterium]